MQYLVKINKRARAEHETSTDVMIAQIVAFSGYSIIYDHDAQAFTFSASDTYRVEGLRQMPWVSTVEVYAPPHPPM